jgi:L-alanine-DL-glutamate epimerase-like enolase superfamily enzyme
VHTLVFVDTDEGIQGVGSVFTTPDLVRAALRLLEPLYHNENPLEPDRVTEKLHQHTFWMGRGGSITHAISGINIALWDILGKATQQPVGRLLGGRYRDRVRPYASILIAEPAAMRDELTYLVENGFTAFKIGWGSFGRRDAKEDELVVRTARDAVGDAALLAVDAGGSEAFWHPGLTWAVSTSYMLRDYGVAWFEEALSPDSPSEYAELRRRSAVQISGGEVLTRRQAFIPFITQGSFDIVQPDVTKVGGLSESRRIGWLAEAHQTRLVPHGWNTAVGLAADLQLASALPGTDLVEYKTGSAYIDDLVAKPWQIGPDGMLAISELPGLGIELDPVAVRRYADE